MAIGRVVGAFLIMLLYTTRAHKAGTSATDGQRLELVVGMDGTRRSIAKWFFRVVLMNGPLLDPRTRLALS